MRTWSLLVVALLILSAGCAGKARPASVAPTSSDPDALPVGVSNRLEGTVKGPDQAPLAAVNVTLKGTVASQLTDEAGYYRFDSLPPKEYTVVAAKEGYRSQTQRAAVLDDQILQVDFTLDEVPVVRAYNDTFPEFKGFISCQLEYETAPDNPSRTNCGDADTNNKPTKDFNVQAQTAEVVVEVQWDSASGPLAQQLMVTVSSLGADGTTFGQEIGKTGLRVDVPPAVLQKAMPQAGSIRVHVDAAPSLFGTGSGPDVGLAFQQHFSVFFTVFYIEPGPKGYSAIPK